MEKKQFACFNLQRFFSAVFFLLEDKILNLGSCKIQTSLPTLGRKWKHSVGTFSSLVLHTGRALALLSRGREIKSLSGPGFFLLISLSVGCP